MANHERVRLSKITAQELNAMLGDGRVVQEDIMRGQSVLKMRNHVIGAVNTDSLMGEVIVSVGRRVVARLTDR